MSKVLIIGSKGFIGSNLFGYYSNSGNNTVWGCDVMADYTTKYYFQIDATNADYAEVFKSQDFDICVNCSGSALVPISLVNPAKDFHLNTNNVFHILDAIRRYTPNCKFINLSSAAVYGNPVRLPVGESQSCHPLSPYGWHKYYSELMCKEFYEVFGIKTVSLRIFSAFGVGLQKQLFWDWYQKAKSTLPIILWGTGNESRDFIYIDDLVAAIDCVVKNSEFKGESINVANGEEVMIADAAIIFKQNLSVSFNYQFSKEGRPGDPRNWQADIQKLLQLGYKKKIGFQDGIIRYIQWLQQSE